MTLRAPWLICALGAVGCNLLLEYDASRPQLGREDQFEVIPMWVDVPLDATIASVPRLVTMVGTRRGTALGAEGVPVEVRAGSCPACCAKSPDAAGRNLAQLGPAEAEVFSLLGDRGCEQQPGGWLRCTLDANGAATFGIVALQSAAIQTAGYLPICVQPATIEGRHCKEVSAVPRLGDATVRLGIVPVSRSAAPNGTRACEDVSSCDGVRTLPFELGVVSADVPPGQAIARDFRPLMQDMTLRVEVAATSDGVLRDQPWLALDSCEQPPEKASLSLTLEKGHRSKGVVLCYSEDPATYEITATHETRLEITGHRQLPMRGAVSRLRQTDDVVWVQRCGESESPVPISDVLSAHGDDMLQVRFTDGSVSCTASAMGGSAGAPSAGAP